MECIIVTNNIRCYEKWKNKFKVEFEDDWTYLDVLLITRDYIHKGYYLLTHPLAGSVKPNQTPFKSIILSKESLEGAQEFRDTILIENSIETFHKFITNKPLPLYDEKSTEDFRTVDLSLMEGALNNPIITKR